LENDFLSSFSTALRSLLFKAGQGQAGSHRVAQVAWFCTKMSRTREKDRENRHVVARLISLVFVDTLPMVAALLFWQATD
jgi:hypothetical protein